MTGIVSNYLYILDGNCFIELLQNVETLSDLRYIDFFRLKYLEYKFAATALNKIHM